MKNESITSKDKEEILRLVKQEWGSYDLVSKGKVYEAHQLPALITKHNDKVTGFLLYNIYDKECEIVAIKSVIEGKGVGSRLIERVKLIARKHNCKRLWVITTNDNIHAQKFYHNRGFRLCKVHEDSIEMSRKLKPQIPFTNEKGIKIKDEYEYELMEF